MVIKDRDQSPSGNYILHKEIPGVDSTHEHGHTLDLILTYGLPGLTLTICDLVFSDDMPVICIVCCK